MWQTVSYVSTADPSLTTLEMENLFKLVKQKNNDLGITGILLYSDGNFMQILEGEKTYIHELFSKIEKDERHYNVIKIFDRQIVNPCFSKYHSDFKVFGESYSHNELQNFLEGEKSYNPDNYKSVSYLTKKFMKLS